MRRGSSTALAGDLPSGERLTPTILSTGRSPLHTIPEKLFGCIHGNLHCHTSVYLSAPQHVLSGASQPACIGAVHRLVFAGGCTLISPCGEAAIWRGPAPSNPDRPALSHPNPQHVCMAAPCAPTQAWAFAESCCKCYLPSVLIGGKRLTPTILTILSTGA